MVSRFRTRAVIGLLIFTAWTGIVRLGIAEGSRHTVWAAQAFGTWPSAILSLDGSNNMELSIRVNYDAGATAGSSTTGTTSDFDDPANMNGSRFITGSATGVVTSMSAYVAAPVDTGPFDQFELAIYADENGAPGRLLTHSARGTLTADTWNTVPVNAALAARTPYWLFYNSNGRHDSLNNLTFAPVVGEPVDSVLRAPRSNAATRIAWIMSLLGSPVAGVVAALGLTLWFGRHRPRVAMMVWAGLVTGLLLEYTLKQTVFSPYATYPSGHALRATFLATIVIAVVPGRSLRLAVAALAVVISLCAVHPNRHYSEEVMGGALVGWTLASAAIAIAEAMATRDSRSQRPPATSAFSRRVGRDRRRHERRAPTEPVQAH